MIILQNFIIFYFSNTVCSITGVVKATSAFSTIFLLNFFSSTGSKLGFPSGYGIATAGTILLAPTVNEIGTTVQICTTGIPVASIAFTIVAPQRVQVPQVDVNITASTPSEINFIANSLANAFEFLTEVPLPTVV